MKKIIPILIIGMALFCCPKYNFGQAPDLGSAANFVLFSSVGAVGNTGISQLTGNIGTDVGAITGFGNVNGGMHNTDLTTAQCKTDLSITYNQLDALVPTVLHAPVLGNGEILVPGIYALAAAGSILGNLTLDAQGNPNAVFIFTIGGALTTAAATSVSLVNGTMACNVFWKVEGAASMAAGTIMRGNIIAHNGAISIGAGCTLEGRALSTTGAVNVYGTLAYTPIGCGSPLLTGPASPDLACIGCYTLFSANGAVSNAGVTHIIGAIGTNLGFTTGFNPAFVTGRIHLKPDPSTAQCAVDLQRVYNYLNSLPNDIELLYPAQFGNGLVLTPHTYLMNAAAAFTDTLYLNAQNNVDAVFVIKINGALSTSSFSKVKLINGTQAKNVYWKVEGAVTINNYSFFCGNIFSNNGAINLTTGVILEGKAFTTTGAVTTNAVTTSLPLYCPCYVLRSEFEALTGVCEKQNVILKWNMPTELNSNFFTVERSRLGVLWEEVGVIAGAGNSTLPHNYTLTDNFSGKNSTFYRLKQNDFTGNYKYGSVINIKNCGADSTENLVLYPNPSNGKFSLLFNGTKPKVYFTQIYNVYGQKVFEVSGTQSTFDLYNQEAGIYLVHVNLGSKTVISKLVLKK